jgi:hypothetical protein
MARTLTARIATAAALTAAAFAITIAVGSTQPGTDHAAAGTGQQVQVVRVAQDLPSDSNPWD